MTITSYLNQSVDHIKPEYQKDKRAQISQIFDQASAASLCNALDGLEFEVAYTENSQGRSINKQSLQAMSRDEQSEFIRKIYTDASKGIGFYYGRQAIHIQNIEQGIVNDALKWLNSAETIDAIKSITGVNDIIAASGQATRFVPGQFLTRHNDVNENDQRRVAYVLNMTPEWHPDWGGLLQFYQNDGTPRDAWSPLHNSMSLFDVNHVHSVTHVAPYALKPRLSISGWFRAKPL